MKYLTLISANILLGACHSKTPRATQDKPIKFNSQLVQELETMASANQEAQQRYTEITDGTLTFRELDAIQDSVFKHNMLRLKIIFSENGYPGYDLVGEEGEYHFWLMVQHCDFDIKFQKAVLAKMETKVQEGQADPVNFGFLTDKVAINSGAPQVYGSQLDYDVENGRAMPIPLTDSVNVDVRRKSIGLPPLYEYLNDRIDDFWDINKAVMEANDITVKPYYNK